MFKHFAANAMTLLIVAGIVVAGVIAAGVQRFGAEGPLDAPARVTIAKGATIGPTSEMLEEAGVIDSASIFRIGARYRGDAGGLRFGEYEIPAKASMEDVLDILISGDSVQYKVTVAEGLTSWEIVELLKSNNLLTGEIGEIPVEGSLAPDTYFIERGMDRVELLRWMQSAQEQILEAAWAARDPATPLRSPEEALILASIIEKETGVGAERALVGGVFTNRLNRGMRLQSDPTIIYGITLGQGALGRGIRRSEINKPSPWNTYVLDRLPRTPIANPGRDAILAATNPAETEALYFVADGTGGHAFAKTLREHERNVSAWRKIEQERNGN